MRRYVYSNLLKMMFGSLLIFTFIPSVVCFIGSLLIDKSLGILAICQDVSLYPKESKTLERYNSLV